tara:strand:+ start:850 stop:3231 length:2382 start_codon:yes stop_codon:yes gene_type:complete
MRYLIFVVLILITSNTYTQTKGKEDNKKEEKPKTISDVVGANAISDGGLFTVFSTGDKVFFEVPDSLLNVDMLLVSRIAKVPSDLSPYLNAGSKVGEQMVKWSKKGNKLLLRVYSTSNVSDENDPILLSVESNNFEPIIGAFEIKAESADSSSALIEVTSLFTSDIKALSGLNSRLRKDYKVKALDAKRSMIESAKSYPINVEVRHIMTYNASEPPSKSKTETLTMLMNQSMILLPKEPMQSRVYDERVGWFSMRKIDYSSDKLKSDEKRYIRRWRLVPKDVEAYKRGELVEPIKPIVYYLDPATPLKWRPYFRKGIEDWNSCFETAGFKNAIIAKDAPTAEEDPDFSPEDARYSVARYVASTTRNAIGPSVSDPRTGEIIESDIIWYHNHLRSYRNRYLLETGAANPKARSLDTPDEEIGEMMRRVISHEIGHALGLPHNMKASAAYPVDSLRSGAFTQKNGIATTIMDYARYNYVAQPGDENIRFIRQLGPYDHYSINWGYRYLPNAQSVEDEIGTLKQWIKEKEGDPVYMFGSGRGRQDPHSQTESIGDDNVKASEYALKNLKVVGKNLINWTNETSENYNNLEEIYGEFLGVYRRYIGHVITNVGGIHQTLKTSDQAGEIYKHVPKGEQQRAISFLLQNAFSNMEWLAPKSVVSKIEKHNSFVRISSLQNRFLSALFANSRLERMAQNEFINGTRAYSFQNMMEQLHNSFWNSSRNDALSRSLQRHHIDVLSSKIETEDDVMNNDIIPLIRNELERILKNAKSKSGNKSMEAIHNADIVSRIKKVLSID